VVTLVLPRDGPNADLTGEALAAFEGDILPAYLPKQRWFADKAAGKVALRVHDLAPIQDGGTQMYLALVDLPERAQTYFLPLAVGSAADAEALPANATLSRVRRGESHGFLCDAFAVDAFVRTFLEDVLAERRRAGTRGGTFAAHAAQALRDMQVPGAALVRRMNVEQSNTSVVIDERVMLKAYRRANRGPQPELEIARFLDEAGYRNTPRLLGYVEYERPGEETTALAILQQFAVNQGDAWAVTLAYLERVFAGRTDGDEDATFVARARTLGLRTAELHRAFARPSSDPAFAPEPVTLDDLEAWAAQARETAAQALDALQRDRSRVPVDLGDDVDNLLAEREAILARFAAPVLRAPLVKTRFHGDYHLGQVLVVDDDFLIVDFEGEPGRDLAVRRRKSSPLRDVAGMLRSIDYAAVAADPRQARDDNGRGIGREWRRSTSAAFLAGYREAIAGCASYPGDAVSAQALLELFLLEKAFYEISYELANRPSWLRIPLEGIRAILDGERSAPA
jgi:maltose alpha-D-glucosyltransferase / alpha-amylase